MEEVPTINRSDFSRKDAERLRIELERDYEIHWNDEKQRKAILDYWKDYLRYHPDQEDKCVEILLRTEKASAKKHGGFTRKEGASLTIPILQSTLPYDKPFLDTLKNLIAELKVLAKGIDPDIFGTAIQNPDHTSLSDSDITPDQRTQLKVTLSSYDVLLSKSKILLPAIFKHLVKIDEDGEIASEWLYHILDINVGYYVIDNLKKELPLSDHERWILRITQKLKMRQKDEKQQTQDQKRCEDLVMGGYEGFLSQHKNFKQLKDSIFRWGNLEQAQKLKVFSAFEGQQPAFLQTLFNYLFKQLPVIAISFTEGFFFELFPKLQPDQRKIFAATLRQSKTPYQLNQIFRVLLQEVPPSLIAEQLLLLQLTTLSEQKKSKLMEFEQTRKGNIEAKEKYLREKQDERKRKAKTNGQIVSKKTLEQIAKDVDAEYLEAIEKTVNGILIKEFIQFFMWQLKFAGKSKKETFDIIEQFLLQHKTILGTIEDFDSLDTFFKNTKDDTTGKNKDYFETLYDNLDSNTHVTHTDSVFTSTAQAQNPLGGHVGVNEDAIITNELPSSALLTDDDRKTLLTETISELHEEIKQKELNGGSTLTLCLMNADTQNVDIAHVGDSRAVKVVKTSENTTQLQQVTTAYNLDNEEELKRIQKEDEARAKDKKHLVNSKHENPRIVSPVNPGHTLHGTRSLGDVAFEDRIGHTPDVHINTQKTKDGETLQGIILASDGLDELSDFRAHFDPRAENIAEDLVQKAIQQGSTDDVSAVYIQLDKPLEKSMVVGIADGHGIHGKEVAQLIQKRAPEIIQRKIKEKLLVILESVKENVEDVTQLIDLLNENKFDEYAQKLREENSEGQTLHEQIQFWIALKKDTVRYRYYPKQKQKEIFIRWKEFLDRNPKHFGYIMQVIGNTEYALEEQKLKKEGPEKLTASGSLYFQLAAIDDIKTQLELWKTLSGKNAKISYLRKFLAEKSPDELNEYIKLLLFVQDKSDDFIQNEDSLLFRLLSLQLADNTAGDANFIYGLLKHLQNAHVPIETSLGIAQKFAQRYNIKNGCSKNELVKIIIQQENHLPEQNSLFSEFLYAELLKIFKHYQHDKIFKDYKDFDEKFKHCLEHREILSKFLSLCIWHFKNAKDAENKEDDKTVETASAETLRAITQFLKIHRFTPDTIGSQYTVEYAYKKIRHKIIPDTHGAATIQGGPRGRYLQKKNEDTYTFGQLDKRFHDFEPKQKEIYLLNVFKKLQKVCGQYEYNGSTANLCILGENTVYSANVGDSYTFLVKKNSDGTFEIECLSKSHGRSTNGKLRLKPTKTRRKDRENQNKGKKKVSSTTNPEEEDDVSLSVDRAIGDTAYEKEKENPLDDGLIHEPSLKETSVDKREGQETFVVIASDGFGEGQTNIEQYLKQKLETFDFSEHTDNFETKLSEHLVQASVNDNSTDNITVVVSKTNNSQHQLLGLFDGHGQFGKLVSDALESHVVEIANQEIEKELKRQEQLKNAIKSLLERTRKYRGDLDAEIEKIKTDPKKFEEIAEKSNLLQEVDKLIVCLETPDTCDEDKMTNYATMLFPELKKDNSDKENSENESANAQEAPVTEETQQTKAQNSLRLKPLHTKIEETRTGPAFIQGVKWFLSGVLFASGVGIGIHGLIRLATNKWLWEKKGTTLVNITKDIQKKYIPPTNAPAA